MSDSNELRRTMSLGFVVFIKNNSNVVNAFRLIFSKDRTEGWPIDQPYTQILAPIRFIRICIY